jgi:hypothetical protein
MKGKRKGKRKVPAASTLWPSGLSARPRGLPIMLRYSMISHNLYIARPSSHLNSIQPNLTTLNPIQITCSTIYTSSPSCSNSKYNSKSHPHSRSHHITLLHISLDLFLFCQCLRIPLCLLFCISYSSTKFTIYNRLL